MVQEVWRRKTKANPEIIERVVEEGVRAVRGLKCYGKRHARSLDLTKSDAERIIGEPRKRK
jgi:hypothetical protein